MSRTTRAKACWSSSLPSRPSRSAPAFSSTQSRQRSTTRSPLFGAARPVSFSRTISATRLLDRRIGLVAHVGEIGLGVFVLEHGADIVGDARSWRARRSPRRAPARRRRRRRAPACLRAPAGVDAHVVAGALQRHGIAEAAGHRDVGRATASSAVRAAGRGCRPAPACPWRSRLRARGRRRSRACRRVTARLKLSASPPPLRLAACVVARARPSTAPVSRAPRWPPIPAVPRRRRAGRTRPRRRARARRTC